MGPDDPNCAKTKNNLVIPHTWQLMGYELDFALCICYIFLSFTQVFSYIFGCVLSSLVCKMCGMSYGCGFERTQKGIQNFNIDMMNYKSKSCNHFVMPCIFLSALCVEYTYILFYYGFSDLKGTRSLNWILILHQIFSQ